MPALVRLSASVSPNLFATQRSPPFSETTQPPNDASHSSSSIYPTMWLNLQIIRASDIIMHAFLHCTIILRCLLTKQMLREIHLRFCIDTTIPGSPFRKMLLVLCTGQTSVFLKSIACESRSGWGCFRVPAKNFEGLASPGLIALVH